MIGIYKITNKITGDYYIGSSVNVKKRWGNHKCPSRWNREHKQLYVDMQKYGVDNFTMEVIEELSDVDTKLLHSREQYYIEQLQPVYNMVAADTGIDTSDIKQYNQQYYSQHIDEAKQYYIEHADEIKQQQKQHDNQQCNYNGELLTLNALKTRFCRQGIEHPVKEAKKYLIK